MLDRQHGDDIVSEVLTPRLAVLITTVDADGVVNAAPYSFFSAVSYYPPMVQLSVGSQKHFDAEHDDVHNQRVGPIDEVLAQPEYADEDRSSPKDTLRNIRDQGEFGVSVLSTEYLKELILTSTRWPRGVSELEKAGLNEYSPATIDPPLVEEAQVAAECDAVDIQSLGDDPLAFNMVLAEVVEFHVDGDVLEDGHVSAEKIDPLLEFSGGTFMGCDRVLHEPRYGYPDVFPDGYLEE